MQYILTSTLLIYHKGHAGVGSVEQFGEVVLDAERSLACAIVIKIRVVEERARARRGLLKKPAGVGRVWQGGI